MAILYPDASALVKLVVEEEGSTLSAALWDAADGIVASRLAHPEVCAALAAAHRNHRLTTAAFRAALVEFNDFWTEVRPIELSAAVQEAAGSLAIAHSLRGADAIHLASVLAVDDVSTVLAVWDRRMHAAALTLGLSVAPASLS